MTPPRAHEAQGVNSIEVGARVLQALEQGRGPMALTDVARGSGLHPAKTHRYLTSLIRSGLAVQHQATGLYDLGPSARQLGVEALRRTDSVSLVSTYGVGLRDRTGHTVNVCVWTDLGATMVRWDTGSHALPIVVRVGSSLPLFDSAVGMVFLAHLPTSVTREVLRRQQTGGSTRRATAAEVRAVVEKTVKNGYAMTRDELIFGLAALAAPVFGADGGLEATVGLIIPAGHVNAATTRELARELTLCAGQASRDLGFDGVQ